MGKLGTLRTGRSTPDLQAEAERVQAEVVGTRVIFASCASIFPATSSVCLRVLLHTDTVKGPKVIVLAIHVI